MLGTAQSLPQAGFTPLNEVGQDAARPANPTLIVDPERIPSARYHDEQFFKLECEQLWPRVWQMACRLEEIPNPGDFVEYEILNISVVLIRSTDGGVKAFLNSCRHRGVKLAEDRGNCKVRGLQCPFHGWRWDMDGHNTFVLQPNVFSESSLDPNELDLKPVRVETWGGCAFINFDDNARPLRDCIEPFASIHDARHADKLSVDWWISSILPVNWKVAMEAFMEGYHVLKTHPQLMPKLNDDNVTYGKATPGMTANISNRFKSYKTPKELVEGQISYLRMLGSGMNGMIIDSDIEVAESLRGIDLPDDIPAAMEIWLARLNEEITNRGRAAGRDMPDLSEIQRNGPWSTVNYCFPNFFLLPYFANMASYRVRPLGPEKCLFELWSLSIHPEGEQRPRLVRPEPSISTFDQFPPVIRQDFANLGRQQAGLRGIEYMRLGRDVEGLISNYHRLIDAFILGASDDELLTAVQRVNGGINVRVADLGL